MRRAATFFAATFFAATFFAVVFFAVVFLAGAFVAAAAPQPAADKAPEEEGGAKPEAEPEVVSVQMAVPGLSSDEVRPRFRPLSAAPSRSTSRPSSRLATSRAPKLLL